MKLLLSIIVFCIFAYFGFLIDSSIVHWIMTKVPSTEWKGLIEIGAWILIIAFSGSIIIAISAAIATLVYTLIDNN